MRNEKGTEKWISRKLMSWAAKKDTLLRVCLYSLGIAGVAALATALVLGID